MSCIHCFSYLHHNRLSSIPDGLFDKLTKLQKLWVHVLMCIHCFSTLAFNQFSSPPYCFYKLTNLQKLWLFFFIWIQCVSHLENNQLSSLPPEVFDPLRNLQELWVYVSMYIQCFSYLYNNKLSFIPAGVFDKLTNLQKLWVNVMICIHCLAFSRRIRWSVSEGMCQPSGPILQLSTSFRVAARLRSLNSGKPMIWVSFVTDGILCETKWRLDKDRKVPTCLAPFSSLSLIATQFVADLVLST